MHPLFERYIYYQIAKAIKTSRERLNLSQEELAQILGVTNVHLSRIECGLRKPSLQLLVEASQYLHISIDDMIDADSEAGRSARAGIAQTDLYIRHAAVSSSVSFLHEGPGQASRKET